MSDTFFSQSQNNVFERNTAVTVPHDCDQCGEDRIGCVQWNQAVKANLSHNLWRLASHDTILQHTCATLTGYERDLQCWRRTGLGECVSFTFISWAMCWQCNSGCLGSWRWQRCILGETFLLKLRLSCREKTLNPCIHLQCQHNEWLFVCVKGSQVSTTGLLLMDSVGSNSTRLHNECNAKLCKKLLHRKLNGSSPESYNEQL